MEYRALGKTGQQVSVICLGTMTYGTQNTQAEGHAQMDMALAHGVNFIDTAEMYPVPPTKETQGDSERIIGSWLKKTGKREQIVLTTKVVGPAFDAKRPAYIRDGKTHLDRTSIHAALDASLQRLQTDYVDLLQVHWPDRMTNTFGQLGYRHQDDAAETVSIEETLTALAELVQAGKVRHIGLSNETPWGVHRYLMLAETQGLPRVASIQNPYGLLNRSFEVGLAEMAIREKVGLMAYSPLGFGVLSGKYLANQKPPGARLSTSARFDRYTGEQAEKATYEYVSLARAHDLDPAQAALAFANTRPFLTSTVIGATTMEQLASNLASMDVVLPDSYLDGVEQIHKRYSNPAP